MPLSAASGRAQGVPLGYPKRVSTTGNGGKSFNLLILLIELERANGFEPSTLTLARLCSTPELRPHSKFEEGGYGP